MDGFVDLITKSLVDEGIADAQIYQKRKTDLPGYFRAEKKWDLVVVHDHCLVAGIEFKSHVGSFSNNFNNRTEEAVGSATDIWTAYREGAFSPSTRPWLGYLMLLEEAEGSTSPVSVREPHFKVFEEFEGASYAKRYEILIMRLLRERLYDGACLILSNKRSGIRGDYIEPNQEIGFRNFVASLVAHASMCTRVQ